MFWLPFHRPFAEFCRLEKNRPGVLVEISTSNQKKKIFLIGDVNLFGSSMGGACLLEPTTIIHRYAYIWQR